MKNSGENCFCFVLSPQSELQCCNQYVAEHPDYSPASHSNPVAVISMWVSAPAVPVWIHACTYLQTTNVNNNNISIKRSLIRYTDDLVAIKPEEGTREADYFKT